jgi:hypothetical protein
MALGDPRIKRALRWILDRRIETPTAKRSELIERASREFDLTPVEAEFLYRQLTDADKPGRAQD